MATIVAEPKRTQDFVMVKVDRENQSAPVLHVRLEDGTLALATMADITRACAEAIKDKTNDGVEAKDEYVARCLLITTAGLRVTGTYRYPAKYLKAASIVERVAMREQMERQAERVAYHTLGQQGNEDTVAQRLITWAEPL